MTSGAPPASGAPELLRTSSTSSSWGATGAVALPSKGAQNTSPEGQAAGVPEVSDQ